MRIMDGAETNNSHSSLNAGTINNSVGGKSGSKGGGSSNGKHHHHHGHGHSHSQHNGKAAVAVVAPADKSGAGEEKRKPIRLQSPAGAQPVSWNWSPGKAGTTIGVEVIDIIRLTLLHFPELEPLRVKLENVDVSNYDQVRSLSKKFNKLMNGTSQKRKEGPSRVNGKELLHQIITRCYNHAVDNEKSLNKHYEAFSSQTYGETSYERMQLIVDELKPGEKDVFVDLGSGVGQLVVQIAGGTSVQRAVGIEIANLPSAFARKLEQEFKKWMTWFGRPYRPFEVRQGDFLSEEYKKLITEEATIIFINNYAFQSDLETRIKRELLSDLKDGTRIISTKPYVPLNKQGAITDRQLNDISVITDVREMRPCPNPCSWTSAYVPYYLHTICRAKLERYFEKKYNSSLRAKSSDTGSRRSSTPNSKASNSRESSVGLRDKSQDNTGRLNGEEARHPSYGPTTRRKWNDYVNELEQQKKNKKGGGSSTSDERSINNSSSNTPAPAGAPPMTAALSASVAACSSLSHQNSHQVNNIVAAAVLPVGVGEQHNSAKEHHQMPATLVNSAAVKMELAAVMTPPPGSAIVNNASSTPLGAERGAPQSSSSTPLQNTIGHQQLIGSPVFEPITPVSTVKQEIVANKRPPAKRTYERKEKSATAGKRGRPSKADKLLGAHASPKMPRLSDDARDGIELMHQMTLSVQAGKSVDAVSMLADMADQKVATKRRSNTTTLLEAAVPFPNLDNPPGPSSSRAVAPEARNSQQYTDRYPGLNKFLDGMRGLYENWFDDVYGTLQTRAKDELTVRIDASTLGQHLHQSAGNAVAATAANELQQYCSMLDQTPVKRRQSMEEAAAAQLASSAGSTGDGGWRHRSASSATNQGANMLEQQSSYGRMEECQRRIRDITNRLAEKSLEFQTEVQQLKTELDALMAESRQHQQQMDNQQQQKQLQQQQLAQQQLLAAQAQLAAAAAAQQNAAAASAAAVQQQQQHVFSGAASAAQQQQQQSVTQTAINQAVAAAAANNQLELLINEIQTQYSRQLTAQQLLGQLTQLGLLGSIAPQDLAALQTIASGAALNGVVHQMSPVAAAAAALHSPISVQRPPPGPSPAQQLAAVVAANGGVGVQNFLSSLESLSNSTTAGATAQQQQATGICANVSSVTAELAHTASSHGMNSASVNSQHNSVGQQQSLSLHQISQNFSAPGGSQPPSVAHASAATAQLPRESTVAEVIAEVAALPTPMPRKPFRPRPSRTTGNGGKRGAQNAQKQQTAEDPKKQEEIERQIQDIVAKALEVDSAAKCAEKERKARSGEKRGKEKGNNSAASSSSSTVPTTSSSSAALDKVPPVVQPLPARAGPSSIEYQVKADNAIMQNFLSAAMAQHKQQQQQQVGVGTPASSTPSAGENSGGKKTPLSGGGITDFRVHSITAGSSSLGAAVQSPSSGQQQPHFSFTPSSVSLAIQGGGASVPMQFAAGNNKGSSASPATFLHPGESCSPPFISLNLPPTTSAALVPPPSNVVVKVEPKLPTAPQLLQNNIGAVINNSHPYP